MGNQFESAKEKVPAGEMVVDMTPNESGSYVMGKGESLGPVKSTLERMIKIYKERPTVTTEKFANGISVIKPIRYNENRNYFTHTAIEELATREEIQEFFREFVAIKKAQGSDDALRQIAWCFGDHTRANHLPENQKKWEDAIPGLKAAIVAENEIGRNKEERKRGRGRRGGVILNR